MRNAILLGAILFVLASGRSHAAPSSEADTSTRVTQPVRTEALAETGSGDKAATQCRKIKAIEARYGLGNRLEGNYGDPYDAARVQYGHGC